MIALITADIGGTSMRAAAYPLDSIHPLSLNKISTENSRNTVFENLVGLIRSVWPENADVAAISVACAGPLDPKTGTIFSAPNIPGLSGFPLGDKLREIFPIPIYVGNDANLAALGEWKYGSGVGHSDLVYLTISTGIGGGIISNNNLLEGSNGLAAEIGHITVQPGGAICSCGKEGHLEAVSSGSAIVNNIKNRLIAGQKSILKIENMLTAYDVTEAARKGDFLAVDAFEKAGFYLGQALASIIHIFNPSIIILGGGVANSGSLLFNPIIEKIKSDIMDPMYLQNLKIVPSKLGDEAGLVGALVIAHQKLNIS